MPRVEELNRIILEGPRDAGHSFARQQAVAELLRIGDPRARETLLALLGDPDRSLRVLAIEGVKRFGDEKVLFAVTQALKDADAEVRRVSAQFLGEFGDEGCLRALEDAAGHESWFVQHECRAAIERIRSREKRGAKPPKAIPTASGSAGPQAGTPAATPTKGTASEEDLLRHVASRLGAPAQRLKEGASFEVHVDEKRKQVVRVLFQQYEKPPRDYVVFCTECGPAEQARYEQALRTNMRLHFGKIAVADREGKPRFVLYEMLPRDAVTPDLAAEIARKVALHGDGFEKLLGPEDKH